MRNYVNGKWYQNNASETQSGIGKTHGKATLENEPVGNERVDRYQGGAAKSNGHKQIDGVKLPG